MNVQGQAKEPLFSVVITIVSDTVERRYDSEHLTNCLDAMRKQVSPPPLEILVPYPAAIEEIGQISPAYPEVTFLPILDLQNYSPTGHSREHHNELRTRGLVAAKGEILGLLEDYSRPDPNWCRRMVIAHQQDYAAVGGAVENGIDRPLNWAVYFVDFAKYQNPLPAGPSSFVSDANVTYKRRALDAIRSSWKFVFDEPKVNHALLAGGERIALSPEPIVYHHRLHLRLSSSLLERFYWGRSYAASRRQTASPFTGILYSLVALLLPVLLPYRIARTVMNKGRNMGRFIKALPLIIFLTIGWSAGEIAGWLLDKTDRIQVIGETRESEIHAEQL